MYLIQLLWLQYEIYQHQYSPSEFGTNSSSRRSQSRLPVRPAAVNLPLDRPLCRQSSSTISIAPGDLMASQTRFVAVSDASSGLCLRAISRAAPALHIADPLTLSTRPIISLTLSLSLAARRRRR